MNEQKFNALVRLLDDPDHEVLAQVESEIYSLGLAAIPRLEAAAQTIEDALIAERIEELVMALQSDHLSEELLAWRKAGGKDLLEGWVLLSQYANPSLNPQQFRDAVNRLAHRTWLQLNAGMNDLERLVVLNKLLYGLEGFRGNYDAPELPENNLLNHLLENKLGNSLSLSVLYAILAEKLDIPLQVVNFQGYYALRYYSKSTHFYIDAFNKGLFFTPQQVERFLKKLGAKDNVSSYKSLTNTYAVLHLLQLLVGTLQHADRRDEAQRFRDLLLAIEIRLGGNADTAEAEE